jgi:hypothetical protein
MRQLQPACSTRNRDRHKRRAMEQAGSYKRTFGGARVRASVRLVAWLLAYCDNQSSFQVTYGIRRALTVVAEPLGR